MPTQLNGEEVQKNQGPLKTNSLWGYYDYMNIVYLVTKDETVDAAILPTPEEFENASLDQNSKSHDQDTDAGQSCSNEWIRFRCVWSHGK